MATKQNNFRIREQELADALGVTRQRLDEIICFFNADPHDQWELRESDHYIFLNKDLQERLFSEEGAYAIAKYMDSIEKKNLLEIIKEFIFRHKERIRNSFISRKIHENSTSLVVRNNRHFLSKKDIISILSTSPARFNQAFEEIQRSPDPLKLYEDFEDIEGVRFYSLLGFYRISRRLAETLTVKDRRGWCEAIEVVGKKTFKMIIDDHDKLENKINSAMNAARKRDSSRCQITGITRDKLNKSVNIVVHHIFSRENYPHLASSLENLITLTQEVHNDFHVWNGGFQKPCTVDDLIQFVNELYPDNYEVMMKLNHIKKILDPRLKKS